MIVEGRLPEKPRLYGLSAGNLLDLEKTIRRLPASKKWIVKLVRTISPWYQVDARLVLSIISIESNFEPKDRSAKNAMGPMQLIPGTADRFNVKDAFNVTQNIRGGLTYLRWLLARYEGNVALVAAGYNANTISDVEKYRVQNNIFWKLGAAKTDHRLIQKLQNITPDR